MAFRKVLTCLQLQELGRVAERGPGPRRPYLLLPLSPAGPSRPCDVTVSREATGSPPLLPPRQRRGFKDRAGSGGASSSYQPTPRFGAGTGVSMGVTGARRRGAEARARGMGTEGSSRGQDRRDVPRACAERTSAFTSGVTCQYPPDFSYEEELKTKSFGSYNALSQQGSDFRRVAEEELEEELEEDLPSAHPERTCSLPFRLSGPPRGPRDDFHDPDPPPEPGEDEIELLDDTLDLEAEQDLESESELESELEPEPQLLPESESELEDEVPVPVSVFVQTSNLAFSLTPRKMPPGPRVNVQIQTAVGPKGALELSISHEPRSPEPLPVKDGLHHTFRSVFVQTSRHLFRIDKLIQASDHRLKQPLGIGCHPFPMRDWPFQKSFGRTSKESLLSGNKLSKMFMEDVRIQTSHPSLGIEGFPPQTPIQVLLPERSPSEIQLLPSRSLSAKFSEPLDFRILDFRPTSASLPPALVSSTATSCNSSSTELILDSKALISCKSSTGLRMSSRSPMTQESTTDLSIATEQPVSPLPLLKPPEAGEPQKSISQEFAPKPGYALNMTKAASERASMEGEVNPLHSPSLAPVSSGPWKEWSSAEHQEIHSDTEIVQVKKELLASCTTQQAQARPYGGDKPQRRRDLSSLFSPVDIPAEYEHPLTARQVAAFQDVFQLFKPGSQGKLDMRSMKGALPTVGIQLSPQEVCEALRRADLDGDGAVDFEDFLGILTDNHRFAQCMDVPGPYSQVPNLPSRTRSTERRIRSRGPRLSNLARPCDKPKPPQREAPRPQAPDKKPIGQRPQSEEGTAELRPAPSPPTLVQSQLPSPPPPTPQSHSLPNVYQ
ncbi:spermatogenesis-associated protein 32 [Vombatus ursinus]|uniref:spermatogenesis-associated protein 32 n=1 Tax=Vombatus ursinus TaxID=29139 RepID=UPI000FFD6CA8|nr:spermatogenesis-associated protein 32 [Vombatus ursinus]